MDDPAQLVDAIIDGIETKKQQTTKFLLRMLPIHATCKVFVCYRYIYYFNFFQELPDIIIGLINFIYIFKFQSVLEDILKVAEPLVKEKLANFKTFSLLVK